MEDDQMNRQPSNDDASESDRQYGVRFLGWQATPSGEMVALYNVTVERHPLFGSTVTDGTLREHNLPVPPAPPRGA